MDSESVAESAEHPLIALVAARAAHEGERSQLEHAASDARRDLAGRLSTGAAGRR
jgi:hypothetical protein